MATIIIEIFGQVIEVGKCIAGPIKRQFNYLCCLNNNIQSLQDEAQKLEDANDGLQMRVGAANNNAQVIYPYVKTWLERANQSKNIIKEIENDIPKVRKERLNLISRYSLSRKAKKSAEALKELFDSCPGEQIIAQDAPPASMESVPLGQNEGFVTRKNIENNVMEALRNKNINIVGLWGMGGVGKTTTAERIMTKVREENKFDETVKVVVTQKVDVPNIQRDIAESLGLKLEVESLSARAHNIRTRLLSGEKSTLIVIDDVWERLNLEELGIPFKSSFGKCKVLLTSRDRNVLNMTEAQNIFEVKILSEREAWDLFREKTGNCVDTEDLCDIAKDVAKECSGLPVALVAVGGTLQNKTSRQVWEDALLQLRSSKPDDLPTVLEYVYKPLKLSYDSLATNQRARSLFLLCSIFEEDCKIDLEILTRYGVALDIFAGLRINLNEARNKTRALIEVLKDHSLLLDSDEHHVKMHDIVRDMAIYIAAEEHHGGFVINDDAMLIDSASLEIFCKDCYWISINNISNKSKYPVELKFPSLCLLMMRKQNEQLLRDELSLPDNLLDGMQEMRVLSVEQIRIRSLPPSIQMLKNLKTLRLRNCPILETITAVGKLLKLEILSCCECGNIKALPTEIGGLNHLRLLEIIDCQNLKAIVPGIISSLVSLEELILRNSFDGWEAKECGAKQNAALAELESLTKLTGLEIEIRDINLVAEEISLPSGIVKYDIAIMPERYSLPKHYSLRKHYFPKMSLAIWQQVNMGNWIKTLVKSAELLELEGNGANQVDLMELGKMKSLTLHSCSSVKKLVNITTGTTGFFTLLEYLHLKWLGNLEQIIPVGYNYTDYSSLRTLKSIHINGCPHLQYLFPVSVAITSLTQLEELRVIGCGALEDIFSDDDRGKREKDGRISHNLHVAFPKLDVLELEDLPKLKAQETLDKIVAPGNLRTLEMTALNHVGSSVWYCLFSSFTNLEYIQITDFAGIKNLMSTSIAGNLVHLRRLEIHSCEMMLEVIAEEEEGGFQIMDRISLFPRLEILVLKGVPKLRSFCQWNHRNTILELPSLRHVYISGCPQLRNFTPGSLCTPKLEFIEINERIIEIKDLNKAIRPQHT